MRAVRAVVTCANDEHATPPRPRASALGRSPVARRLRGWRAIFDWAVIREGRRAATSPGCLRAAVVLRNRR